MPEAIEPFTIAATDEQLRDLRERLARTRWPIEIGDNDQWQAGANLAYMRALTDYWLNGYDWRAQERAMNAVPQFRTRIDGVPVHFVHVQGKGPSPVPLILNHGWPWTFWDMRKLIAPLADPASFGGDAADAFDVIVPSLPGFGFSSPLESAGMNFFGTAHLWVKLMDRLGYGRFATQGGDFGGMVAAMLGHAYPDRVIGAHLHYIAPLKPPYPEPEDYAPHEAWYPDKAKKFAEQQIGYQAIQRTKPQTPAFALNDSPVGLAAWLVEKRYHWADVREGLEAVFSKDDLLNTAMIYWLTETYVTSARYYYEARPGNAGPVHNRLPVVEAPVAVLQFLEDVKPMPRKWAERYYNLKRWNLADKGGHFAPMEAPGLMIADIRAFFRELR